MHALPAEDDESPQPLGTSEARSESVRKSSNVDMSAWQGGYPPLVEIMRVMTSILEGLMVCTSCSGFLLELTPVLYIGTKSVLDIRT